MEYLAGRIGAVLSVASAGCNTTNLVANLEVGHSRSHGNDLSSNFKTGNVAGTLWRRIHANTLRRRGIMRLLSKNEEEANWQQNDDSKYLHDIRTVDTSSSNLD